MNETMTFGEIDIIPMADGWEPPDVAGHRVPMIPLSGEGLGIGPEPGYSIRCGGPFSVLPYPDVDDPGNLGFIVAWEPAKIRHAYYGEAVVPPGTWQLRLRRGGTAPEEQ